MRSHLRVAVLVAHDEHGHPMCQQQRRRQIAHLLPPPRQRAVSHVARCEQRTRRACHADLAQLSQHPHTRRPPWNRRSCQGRYKRPEISVSVCMGQQARGLAEGVGHLTGAQGRDAPVAGRALLAAVPRQVVLLAITAPRMAATSSLPHFPPPLDKAPRHLLPAPPPLLPLPLPPAAQ